MGLRFLLSASGQAFLAMNRQATFVGLYETSVIQHRCHGRAVRLVRARMNPARRGTHPWHHELVGARGKVSIPLHVSIENRRQ
jgi:hypothetical protein